MRVVGATGQDDSSARKRRLQTQQLLEVGQEGEPQEVALSTHEKVRVLHVDVDHKQVVVEHMATTSVAVGAGVAPGQFGSLVVHPQVKMAATVAGIAAFTLGHQNDDGTVPAQIVAKDLRVVTGLDVLRDIVVILQVKVGGVTGARSSSQNAITVRANWKKK